MKVKVLTVHWHADSQPIYSGHFQPNGHRFATGGGDNNIRIWSLKRVAGVTGVAGVNYLSTLSRHTQAVNVVRFSPQGDLLASAGDDGTVLIWSLSETAIVEFGSSTSTSYTTATTTPAAKGDEDAESWKLISSLRTSISEIYDLAWSPDGKYIVTGSMDNIARVYDVAAGRCVKEIRQHGHYVQGVAWDPLGEFIATQSSDRSVGIHKVNSQGSKGGLDVLDYAKVSKGDLPVTRNKDSKNLGENVTYRSGMLFHNETFTSFFRRLTFSPDGGLLFTPSGIFKYHDIVEDDKNSKPDSVPVSTDATNTVFIFTRAGLNRPPVAQLPGLKKPSLAIKCSPILYKLQPSPSVFQLEYRIVYAVATQDSVIIYDTQQSYPLAVLSNLHYATYTDLAWSNDGQELLMTSTDGFCSVASFEEGELGHIYEKESASTPVIKRNTGSVKDEPIQSEFMTDISVKTEEKLEVEEKVKPVESILKFTNPIKVESVENPKSMPTVSKKRRIAPTFVSL